MEQHQNTFSKTEFIKRVRKLAMTEWKNIKGYKFELQDLMGCNWTFRELTKYPELLNRFAKHNSEFRMMISSTGRNSELVDICRINIGNDTTPPFVVR